MNNSNTASNWPEIPIGKTGQVLGGRQRSPHATGSPQKYLRVANVFDGYIDSSDVFEMPFSEEESKRFLLAPGDILLNEGQSLELVGRSAVYRGDPPDCCFQNTLIRYRANSDVLPEFAQYTFQNFLRLGKFAAIASQTTSIAHLGTGRFAALPMPVPPLDEQRAIASALSDTDALLAKLDQLIAKKRGVKQAAMQELLTGRRRLPGFSGEWKHTSIGEVCEVKTGPFGSSLHESDYVKEGTPIITVEHLGEFGVTYQNLPLVSKQDWTRLREYTLEAGDIVFSRVGSVDRNALIKPTEDGWLFSGRLLRVRVKSKNALASFLSHQFHLESFKKKVREVAVGQTMASINTQILKNIQITLPPTDEQAAIALIISEMNTEVIALEARREKTRRLKQGMMQELLSGRVRLI
ncbi:restriction endonuclease subunit S [Sphaerotilus montanus]|uniref:restriction endonuclease subunit S n=1 Tax=Sphaerotilus montanus TaxID=522889 RepID=UPI003FA1CF35